MVGQSWTPAMVVMVHVMSTEVRTPWLKKPPMERGRKSILAAWNVASGSVQEFCKQQFYLLHTHTHTHTVSSCIVYTYRSCSFDTHGDGDGEGVEGVVEDHLGEAPNTEACRIPSSSRL